jgi:inner membrane protein
VLLARNVDVRKYFVFAGLGITGMYLLATIGIRWIVVSRVESELREQATETRSLLVTPTPLNSMLWFVAAADKTGFHTAHVSVFDDYDSARYVYFPQREYLLAPVNETPAIRTLKSFSGDFYTAELWGDTLVFNDLRFGQMKGWMDPRERFVFHYFVGHTDENILVMQRGRFAGWDMATVRGLLIRMTGGEVSLVDENRK